ncbi:hypothetical protein ANN_13928 [Periplaneta americana]|uniref:Uncharacterized protein n=1 Tax=Periplaneta americana TaxID=6978 RepID=A0ABQ8SVW5_PERAM|nr:hypothetical protein ANN_13928 [Periplaneta americana]
MHELRIVFGDRIISRELWPPRSPDLSPSDFYLWGTLKNKVYASNPHTLQELKDITREIQIGYIGNVFELKVITISIFRDAGFSKLSFIVVYMPLLIQPFRTKMVKEKICNNINYGKEYEVCNILIICSSDISERSTNRIQTPWVLRSSRMQRSLDAVHLIKVILSDTLRLFSFETLKMNVVVYCSRNRNLANNMEEKHLCIYFGTGKKFILQAMLDEGIDCYEDHSKSVHIP